MARTLQVIYDDLVAGKETDDTLDTLLPVPDSYTSLYPFNNFKLLANTIVKGLSTSKVAVHRLIMWIVAYGIWTHEKLWDVAKVEIQDTLDKNIFGSLPWYSTVAKKFQDGDELVLINSTSYGYLVIDETKYLVTQACAHIASGEIIVKVAKGTIGSLSKLTAAEKIRFEEYINSIAPAGSNIVVITDDADIVSLNITVFVDALILDNTGTKIGTSETPVSDAIETYLQTIPFDSYFRVIDLVDAIQAAEGVKNVVVSGISAKSATGATYTNVLTETGQKYLSNAGYFTQTGSTITYSYE
jgi:hypothetical protein